MKRLEKLPEITEEMLGGIHASQELKNDILRDAEKIRNGERVQRNTPWENKAPKRGWAVQTLRTAGALACIAIFLVGILVGMPQLLQKRLNENEQLITVYTGGGNDGGRTQALDMPKGSITISNRDKPDYRGVWAPATGANFPLICADGRYYRLMSNPTSIGSELLGNVLGTVDTFSSEPALASGGIISNIVPAGETVYSVFGMDGALAAARVDGSLRVFQRVSFGNTALKSGEKLADTLCASSVTAMELTGVGTVTNAAEAQRLYSILQQNAQLTRAGSSETAQSLLIQLQNGIVLQMSVRDESLMACGTWLCPEFFDAFAVAVK